MFGHSIGSAPAGIGAPGAKHRGPPAGAPISRRQALRLIFAGIAASGRAWGTAPAASDASRPAGTTLLEIGELRSSGVDGIRIPDEFSLRVVARCGFNPVTDRLDPLGLSGYPWHKAPDGGACFAAPDGGWVYVSNCESKSSGGVGALRFAADGRIVDAYRVLDSTRRNCAGGPTPWGTWLSCEEIEDGGVFECDPFARSAIARPLPALGVFNHEAAAVHRCSRAVFLTEDAGDGRLYRFVADEAIDGRLSLDRGRLQVLVVEGCEDGANVPDAFVQPRPFGWVDAEMPHRPQAAVRARLQSEGRAAPGTAFKGAEGVWVHDGAEGPGPGREAGAHVFFACKGDNRIFALDLARGLIEPIFEGTQVDPPVRDVDNLVVSAGGDIVVAEDGPATRLLVMQVGRPAKVLLAAGHEKSELTGLAFSPDGSRLYFSSQRGPNLKWRSRGSGVTYELLIPLRYRAAQAGWQNPAGTIEC